MAIGDAGKEQFRSAIVTFRNLHIAALLAPLMLLREELITNDDLSDRGGTDDPTRDHFLQLLGACDLWRRRVTHNPDDADLGTKIAQAIDADAEISDADNPFGGDDIQMGSGGLFDLPWDLSGEDANIPLNSALELASNNGLLLLGAVDRKSVV